jgi:hypothetical protein
MRLKLLQKYLHTHVYCRTTYNSQAMKTAKVPHNQWMDQENVVSIYNGILLSHKEEWNFAIHLSKVTQAQKAKNHTFSLICEL